MLFWALALSRARVCTRNNCTDVAVRVEVRPIAGCPCHGGRTLFSGSLRVPSLSARPQPCRPSGQGRSSFGEGEHQAVRDPPLLSHPGPRSRISLCPECFPSCLSLLLHSQPPPLCKPLCLRVQPLNYTSCLHTHTSTSKSECTLKKFF